MKIAIDFHVYFYLIGTDLPLQVHDPGRIGLCSIDRHFLHHRSCQ